MIFDFFCSKEHLFVKTPYAICVEKGFESLENVPVSQVRVNCSDGDRLREYLKEQGKTSEEIEQMIPAFRMEDVAQHYPQFPILLGRRSLGLDGTRELREHFDEDAPLLGQLTRLKDVLPMRSHRRFLILNGFGGNLGDALVGDTALRQLIKVLREQFDSFSIDLAHGFGANSNVQHFFSFHPEVGHQYFGGMRLEILARYDGVFEFSYFLGYPFYHDAAWTPIDFYLYWLGLSPEAISSEDKRNHAHLFVHGLDKARDIWEKIAVPTHAKKLFFAPNASVPLRSIPKEEARRLVLEILAHDPDVYVLMTDNLEVSHERLFWIESKLSLDEFSALMSTLDGLISVDTYMPHLADACAVPSVMLCVVLPPARYRYYPFVARMLLPDAETLPGWLKSKMEAEDWERAQSDYVAAWKKMRGAHILETLSSVMQSRSALLNQHPKRLSIHHLKPSMPKFASMHTPLGAPSQWVWTHEICDELLRRVDDWMWLLGEQVTLQHGEIVVSMPANRPIFAKLGQKMGEFGRVHVYEPRRLCAQTQAVQFMLAGATNLYLYDRFPEEKVGHVNVSEIDPFSPFSSQSVGNMHVTTRLQGEPLDALGLNSCQLLVLYSPTEFSAALRGANHILKAHTPFVAFAPASIGEIRAVFPILTALGYEIWAKEVIEAKGMYFCIGKPADSKLVLSDLMLVTMD